MFFSSTSVSTLLHVLALVASACLPFVAAQFTTDQFNTKISSTAAPPGYNVDGGSVFNNFVNALNDGQLFFIQAGTAVFEKPGSEIVDYTLFIWCSDLIFSDFSNSSVMGYAGRCVEKNLAGYAEAQTAGAQLVPIDYPEGFGRTMGISAVYVEQLSVFEGQLHQNTDDWIFRYWDDGRETAPTIGWEGHDEGDMSPNAGTASLSAFGEFAWMSVEEVAQLLNKSVDEFTPETFKQVYKNTWIKGHEEEAATQNPNPEAELAIIEQVMNETDSSGETTSPAETNTEGDGGSGTNTATPIEDDGSAGNGRKLVSATARFVSAALRVFGI